MAKKKSSRSRKTSRKTEAPQHTLPTGFWSQVAAFALIAFSLLLVVSWFGAGGPAFNWIRDASLRTIGYATYVLPIVSVAAANAIHNVVAATRWLVSGVVSIELNDAVVAVDPG